MRIIPQMSYQNTHKYENTSDCAKKTNILSFVYNKEYGSKVRRCISKLPVKYFVTDNLPLVHMLYINTIYIS